MSQEELFRFVGNEKNGLYKSAESDGVKVVVTYKPTDVMVAQDLRRDVVPESLIDSMRRAYEPYHYFTVSFSKGSGEALNAANTSYSELVNVLSFRMNENVRMTTSAKDTIPVADYILNRTYGMASSTDLLFVFTRERIRDAEWIQIDIDEFGLGIGNNRFRFDMDDIENSPRLDFSL